VGNLFGSNLLEHIYGKFVIVVDDLSKYNLLNNDFVATVYQKSERKKNEKEEDEEDGRLFELSRKS
jgi:hypothetical protein